MSAFAAGARVRAKRSVEAMFCADAAQMPLHWIYDGDALRAAMVDAAKPEFNDKRACPFYNAETNPGHYGPGDLSPYGEEALALLDYMDANGGEFVSGDGFATHLHKWAKGYGGRKNHCTKDFEAAFDRLVLEGKTSGFSPTCGADDAQANCFAKAVLINAKYGAGPDDVFMHKLDAAVRTHQNNDTAVAFARAYAKMLRAAVVKGAGIAEAIESAKEGAPQSVLDALALASSSETDMAMFLSDLAKALKMEKAFFVKSCGIPQSFIVCTKIMLDTAASGSTDLLEFSVRRNISVGGDTCGRSLMLAPLLASVSPSSALSSWQSQTRASSRVNRSPLLE